MGMISEFKSFLMKTNALALAIGVVIGAAVGKVVSAIVDDVIMPIVGIILPGGDWRDAKIVLSEGQPAVEGKAAVTENAIKYGDLIGKTIDFVIIAWVVFIITKAFLREAKAEEKKA
jgi:large conductance mechanosensitive channel